MVKFISTDGNISSIFIRCILLISAYFIAPCQQNMILIYTWRATISRSGPLDLILEAKILHGGVSMCDYHIPIIWNTEVAFTDDVSSVLSEIAFWPFAPLCFFSMAVYPSFIVDQVHNNPTSNGLSESVFSFPEVVTMKRVSLNISNGSLIFHFVHS